MLNLKPTYTVNGKLCQLSLDELKASGITAMILDLDNTLMVPGSAALQPEIEAWLIEAQKHFKLIVLTNNTKKHYTDKAAQKLAQYQISVIASAAKPFTKKAKQALAELNCSVETVCLVGDRPLTDIWGGLRLGCQTALVEPLLGKDEILLFQILRKLERLSLAPSHR